MRKEIFRMERADALALLERAPVVHLASTGEDGAPILRTVHGVVVRGALAFHGAPAGEKTEAIGRAAVASAEEMVAPIPSYFMDPERACPATTLYRSTQVHGRIEQVDDPEEKAEVLAALMRKLQPEGGYTPITAGDPLYRKAVLGIMILRIPLELVDGKHKLAQNRTPEERIRLMEKLWERGDSGDARAVELIRAASAGSPLPAFLRGPEGTSLVTALSAEDAPAAAALLAGSYWNDGFSEEQLARAHVASVAWVGARDARGVLVATARAVSDHTKGAWIYDVMIAPDYRGKGVGEAVMRLLLAHPALRGVRRIYLRTRDAQTFYERFGFRDRDAPELAPHMVSSTEMVLLNQGAGRRTVG